MFAILIQNTILVPVRNRITVSRDTKDEVIVEVEQIKSGAQFDIIRYNCEKTFAYNPKDVKYHVIGKLLSVSALKYLYENGALEVDCPEINGIILSEVMQSESFADQDVFDYIVSLCSEEDAKLVMSLARNPCAVRYAIKQGYPLPSTLAVADWEFLCPLQYTKDRQMLKKLVTLYIELGYDKKEVKDAVAQNMWVDKGWMKNISATLYQEGKDPKKVSMREIKKFIMH